MQEKKIGEILLERRAIKPFELEKALYIQASDKSSIGKILIGENYITQLELHKAIAQRHGLEFIDLINNEPDYSLLKDEHRHEYFAHGVVPCEEFGGRIRLAAIAITDELKLWASKTYQDREVYFSITSPIDIRHVLQKKFAHKNCEDARLALWNKKPAYSARRLFSGFVLKVILTSVLSVVIASVVYETAFLILAALMNILFIASMSFKNVVFLRGLDARGLCQEQITNLPVYTILLPLFKETATLPKLIKSIENLDYPKSKLDVKFVVEADDNVTIDAIKKLRPPQYMEIITVPYSLPRTKPKACNYALNFARGEYVTIYDAEDMPDPKQLKTVLAKFSSDNNRLACIQARLNYYNYNDNQLTKWFALEYSIWFDAVIYGLEKLKMPIPLGGTSNHVRTSVLKEVGGWDAFNVTEDADLGMRLAQEGYVIKTVNSLTMEEAPNKLYAWTKQRTRWIKGFMQTYIVHMRKPITLARRIGLRSFLSFQFFIGIPVMLYITAPILFIAAIIFTAGHNPLVSLPGWLNAVCWFNLFYGVGSHITMCLITTSRARRSNGQKMFDNKMIFSSFTFYLYGVFHVIAAYRALYQLFTAPHFWEKTQHGLAKNGV